MERLSTKKKLTIVRQYLSGLSYDEIAAKNSVSKGTVANVVAELKAGKFPEAADVAEHIEQLRELSLDLKRLKLTPEQCATGLILLTRINECGLDPADIDRWPLILKSMGNEDEAQEFVRLVYSIQEVQKRTGLSLDALDDKVHELEKKAAELEPMSRQQEDYRKQVAELTRQRKELASAVANLEEKYKLLNPRVKDLEKREQDLSRRIKDMEPRAQKVEATISALNGEMQKLQDTGLPLEALSEFNQRLQVVAQHHNIAPAELRGRLLQELESLDQGLGLETLIQSHQQELEEQEQAVAEAKQELETTKAVVGSLKQEKASLEASIKETREKISKEIGKITPMATDTINLLVEELRRGHSEALVEVRRLKDKALEVGKEVGRYEGILQVNEWLNELLALVRGEESLEGKRVRVIVLLVLRGAVAWLKHNKGENLVFSPLLSTAESLIRELEQWKV
jgi:predicted  nucleic acid-binding Zn-ribbon protein